MSKRSAMAFIEKFKSDETFRHKIMAAKDDSERIRLINAAGFNCTAEEIDSLEQNLRDKGMDKICGGNAQLGEGFFTLGGAIKNFIRYKFFR
jgi:predicted ribosomally synthesized peptide with nif11-like leader